MPDTSARITKKFENSDGFLPYIEEIRFPMYKSLEDGMIVPLDWPIVALVGPNGTNKSSVLQAISAAPEGRSLAEFWFSTAVDDIDESTIRKGRHRFIYKWAFDRSGVSAECRKSRVARDYRSGALPKPLQGKKDPDYWEPTKPTARDGMSRLPETGYDAYLSKSRDRWNQIRKPVLYLDFRSELSAFDKFIHHDSFDRWTPDSTTKRYRAVLRSKPIAKALAGIQLTGTEKRKLIKAVRYLEAPETESIATILGKPIERIALVEHRFFGPDGITIRLYLKDSGSAYSEAHAGSGEYAVVRLVDAISRADDRSLILLDEPEVSLHPGAQNELMQFLLREVLRKGHQVVISTHSPELAGSLPHQAIKVFGFDASSERVVLVANGCSPTEAFTHLGQITAGSGRPRLIVEDELAAELVKASLRHHAPTKLDSLDIVPFPGGASGIVKNVIPAFVLAKESKTGVLLDGDQRTSDHDPDLSVEGAIAADRSVLALNGLWTSQIHATRPELYSNSDHSGDARTLESCLLWADRHLGFLPGKSPEDALALAADPTATPLNGQWKEFWVRKVRVDRHLTASEPVTAELILDVQRSVLSSLAKDSELLVQTAKTVGSIIAW
jgi:predicted ATPase